MALERNAYKALESVVGSENISEDPFILLGYAFATQILPTDSDSVFTIEPEAVILPGSTEEVQGIIKVCNRYKVKYKAHSTGWGTHALPGLEGVVMVDLRRMNRLIDIDEKNMFAVIEPYVLAGQLQAEAMKRGLNCHIAGPGPSHSPLASATSMAGVGYTGLTTSQNERNLFGVEWVLPTGEVLRLGSPGSGAGWFSGDGPGPSLRGIMRGWMGAFGGLGIFTKIGFKLYPWPGPDKLKRTGEHPQIGMETPENFKYYYPYWECWEDVIEATYQIHDSGIGYTLNKVPPDWADWMLTKTNNEFYELYKKGALPIKREHRMGFNVIIAARSEREFEYKKKVLEKIVEDTKGKFLALSPEQEAILLLGHTQSTYAGRGFRPTGAFSSSFGHNESVGLMKKVIESGEECIADNVKPGGKFVEFGPEGFWGWSLEGRMWWQENAYALDHTDRDSQKASLEYALKTISLIYKAKGGLGRPSMIGGPEYLDQFGPSLCNVQDWLRKVKNVFDPQNSSDHSAYVSPEPSRP